MGCGDVAGRADVGLADFDETASAGQQLQRRIDELSGKAVEHDVHALPTGGLAEGVEEIQRARRGDVPGVDPQPGKHVMFVRVGGGENLGTEVAGDLDGGLTHTASAGMDEHPLPRREPGDLDQGDIGGQKRHRHRGGLGKRPTGRDGYHRVLIGDRGGRERVVREKAHHRIAGPNTGDLGAGVKDDPGRFAAQAFIADSAQRHDHVMEVQPGGPYLNADLPGGQRGGRTGRQQGEVGQVAFTRGGQLPVGGIRWGQGQGAGHARDMDDTIAQSQLRLADRWRQGDGKQVVLGGGAVIGIEQNDAVGVLVLGGVDHAPERGVGQIGDTVMSADADRVKR